MSFAQRVSGARYRDQGDARLLSALEIWKADWQVERPARRELWRPETAVEAYRGLAATAAEDWLRETPLHRALTERTGQ